MAEWTFLTSHGLVLVSIAKDSEKTAREIGDDVGLTERTTHSIIIDLEKEGYITRKKVGRHNKYRIHPDMEIKDPVTHASVGELLTTLGWSRRSRRKKTKIEESPE